MAYDQNYTPKQLFFIKHLENRHSFNYKFELEPVYEILTMERYTLKFESPYKRGKINKDCAGWELKIWPLVALPGFSFKKSYGRFAGTK